ncbi:MAG TPA: hypothetical protein VNZ52_03150 [Candidatus Thermoplasmatota archaeon]|nr:hypothetical protein [Candidatus Thermoplasmatota archaeon]
MSGEGLDSYPWGALLVGLALIWGGGWLIRWAWRHLRARRTFQDVATAKVRSAAVGPVELRGRIVADPRDDPVVSHLTGKPCAAIEARLDRVLPPRRLGDREEQVRLEPIWRCDVVSFGLDDGTGTMRVIPKGNPLPMEQEEKWSGSFGRGGLPSLKAHLKRRGVVVDPKWPLRYSERRIDEGTEVQVIGTAIRDEHATTVEGNAALIVVPEGRVQFMVLPLQQATGLVTRGGLAVLLAAGLLGVATIGIGILFVLAN